MKEILEEVKKEGAQKIISPFPLGIDQCFFSGNSIPGD
jgi:hypothetical protein